MPLTTFDDFFVQVCRTKTRNKANQSAMQLQFTLMEQQQEGPRNVQSSFNIGTWSSCSLMNSVIPIQLEKAI